MELKTLLVDLSIQLVTPGDINLFLKVEEKGSSYRENAFIKAQEYARYAGMPALADDSGLEVNLLGGAPGIHSARFAPHPGAKDSDRRKLLLEKLLTYSLPWKARFCCVVSVVTPGGKTYFGEGVCEGEIIPEERGRGGFGYDPIFLVKEVQLTMAELSLEQKNQLSHRARAIQNITPYLMKLSQ